MIDISKQTVGLKCPACKRAITVTLKQVADEDEIKCTCGQKVQLQDSNGTNQRAIQKINKSLTDLNNTFKKFGR